MEKIAENLFCGDIRAAQNLDTLIIHNVKHIVQTCDGNIKPMFPETFKYKVFEVHDSTTEKISKLFHPICQYLKQAISMGETCLIYGLAGTNVSGIFAAAYLCQEKAYPAAKAMKLLKNRTGAQFNPSFKLQLNQFAQNVAQAASRKQK